MKFMKLLIMLISALALILGLIGRAPEIVILGAIIHLSVGIAEHFGCYRAAKAYRAGVYKVVDLNEPVWVCSSFIEQTIAVAGLVLAVFSKPNTDYQLAGIIIWGGTIINWIISGIILKNVACIPLSMGPGGWAVRVDKRGRIRE